MLIQFLAALSAAGATGNTLAVTASQSGHSASATVVERVVASASASQAKPTAAASLTERYVVSASALQSSAHAAASVAERFIVAASSAQAPATISAVVDEALALAANAVQSPASASAVTVERFVADGTIVQAPHSASASARETFVLGVDAQQAPNATANPGAPAEITVSAQQAPATISATLSLPGAEQSVQQGGFAYYRPVPRPQFAEPEPDPSLLLIWARQAGHAARAAVEQTHAVAVTATQPSHVATIEHAVRSLTLIRATQAGHDARAAANAEQWADDELALLLMAS